MLTVCVSASLRQSMLDEARERFPEEACGFLLGVEVHRVDEVLHVANEAAEPRRHYLIDPERYLRIQAEASGRKQQVIGVWHSHPAADAVPSATDLAQAWPDWHYLIVGWPAAETPQLRAWWSAADGFQEETLQT
ncbi:M67 family metallopeptidase [Methylonatrum kenyense]|uniref:M67 family metallopeptidase n=1 Tax=Methylonatrum kenyense TaxID=455253 RepID=UPI0020C16341|nr:M67 family metallopeptidase [Methylonatrum kenyense]MCK8514816.1 M67 family metallopeptidase [Methylonatrum kenyense]